MSAGMLGDDVFVHFLEHEILALVDRRQAYGVEAEWAFRTSLLVAERTVVPATAYWEDSWAAPLLESFAPFRAAGRLQLIGTATNPHDYLAIKREHYARDPKRYPRYFEDPTQAEYDRLTEMWRTRLRSTTSDIATFWQGDLLRGDVLFDRLLNRPGTVRTLDEHLLEVPDFLGTDAFIGDFVDRVLQEREVLLDPPQRQFVGQIVMRNHARSFLVEIGGTALRGGPTSAVDALLEGAPFSIDLRRVSRILELMGLAAPFACIDAEQLLSVCESVEWAPVRADILARAAARTRSIWSPEEAVALTKLEPMHKTDPVQQFRATCTRYTRVIRDVAKERLIEEADLEGRRKGHHIEIHGDMHGDVGQVGDKTNVTIVGSDVRVTGRRLQLAGRSLDLEHDSAQIVRHAIPEVVATASPEDAPRHLEAISKVVDQRADITETEITEEIVSAFSGPRAISLTERLKATGANIAQQATIGAVSGGLTSAVLVALKALGLA
jgi:hypothetical protein